MTKSQAQLNIKLCYLFTFFVSFMVLIPVVIPFFQSFGLNMEDIYILQAVFGISMVLFEIPSGYLSDVWSRKKTLILGSAFYFGSFMWLNFCTTFFDFIIYEIICAIGISFISGTDFSILYDSMKDKHLERAFQAKAIAKMNFFSLSGESLAALLASALILISINTVVWVQALASCIPLLVCIFMTEPEFEKMKSNNYWTNTKEVLYHLFKSNRLLLLIFINMVIWSLSTFIAVWMYQKYWEEINIPIFYFGIIWSILNITTAIVGTQVTKWENHWGPLPLMFILSLCPVIAYWGMSYSANWLGLALALLFYVSRGINGVIFKEAVNWRTPSKYRATVNSLSSFMMRFIFFIVGPMVGYFIDKIGIFMTQRSLAYFFLGLFFIAMLPLIQEIKKQKKELS